jgi:AraC family cel operon transcriptional repressor
MDGKKPVFVPEYLIQNNNAIAHFETSCPWKTEDVSFNFIKFDFPYYHTHTHWEIGMVAKGELTHNISGLSYRITEGDACLVRPHDVHNLTALNRNTTFWHLNFLIKTEYIKNIFASYGAGFYEQLLNENKPLDFKINGFLLDKIINKCLQIQTLETENIDWNVQQCKLQINEIINVFLEQYFPSGKNYPSWLNDLLKYLNDPTSFGDDAEFIAKKTPYTYSHLSFLFKQLVGSTLTQYINNVKINYAKELLCHSEQTILEIAGNLNFDSPSHLNHIFKKLTGITPTEFKKRTRQNLRT